MTDKKLRSAKSLLSEAASELGFSMAWYKDPYKIVAAALSDDPDRRKALIEGLEELVKYDTQFSLQLLDKLKEQRQGKIGQRLARPRYIDEWIFTHVNMLLHLENIKSKEVAFQETSNFFIENKIRTLGDAAVKKIYYEVKKFKEG
jgi:hypothetical protein